MRARRLQIGPYVLPGPFVLAPMAGISDAPFRRLCRRYGAAMTTSEMTTADTSLWQTAKSRRRLDLDLDCEPVVVQIAGSDPLQLAEAARACVDRGAQIIDINMGCPAKKVCRKLAGSSLLRDEQLIARILTTVVSAVSVPVTLKTRTGWDSHNRNVVSVAHIAEDSGIKALTVHGRTRECRFRGQAEYETIAEVKQRVSIPVIANGDIHTPQKALDVLRKTGVDGLMIGRAAQGRPWIFREMQQHYDGLHFAPLEKKELRAMMLDHLREIHRFYGESTGVRVARKHLVWYCHNLGSLLGNNLASTDELRHQVVRVDSAQAQQQLIKKYFDRNECGGYNTEPAIAPAFA